MQPMNERTREDHFAEALGNAMTQGRFSMFQGIFGVLFDIHGMLLAVFLRKNMGRGIARIGSWSFTVIWLTILFFIAAMTADHYRVTGQIDETSSMGLLVAHGWLYIFFSAWRRIGAWWDLRNKNKERGRLEYEIGSSVIYPFLRFFLKPLRLIDNEVTPKTLWKLNENRWMEIWEPLLVGAAGFYIHHIGYEIYGNLIMVGAACLFYQMFRALNNTAKIRKSKGHAKTMADMTNASEKKKSGGYVIR